VIAGASYEASAALRQHPDFDVEGTGLEGVAVVEEGLRAQWG